MTPTEETNVIEQVLAGISLNARLSALSISILAEAATAAHGVASLIDSAATLARLLRPQDRAGISARLRRAADGLDAALLH